MANEIEKTIEELEAEVLSELEEQAADAPKKGAAPAEPAVPVEHGVGFTAPPAPTVTDIGPGLNGPSGVLETKGEAVQQPETDDVFDSLYPPAPPPAPPLLPPAPPPAITK